MQYILRQSKIFFDVKKYQALSRGWCYLSAPCVSREKQFSVLIFTVEYVLVRILEFCHIAVKFSKWLKEIGRSQPTQRLHLYPDFDR